MAKKFYHEFLHDRYHKFLIMFANNNKKSDRTMTESLTEQ